MNWTHVCNLDELVPGVGVCALVDEEQIAIFRPSAAEKVFAISNYDPKGKAWVLSRGMTGDLNHVPVVASPLYKQHYNLYTGECIEDSALDVKSYAVKIEDNKILIGS